MEIGYIKKFHQYLNLDENADFNKSLIEIFWNKENLGKILFYHDGILYMEITENNDNLMRSFSVKSKIFYTNKVLDLNKKFVWVPISELIDTAYLYCKSPTNDFTNIIVTIID